MSKNFKDKTPAEILISGIAEGNSTQVEVKESVEETVSVEQEENPKAEELKKAKTSRVPKGYKLNNLYIETKSKKLQVLARPSTIKEIQKIAKKNKLSTNELINRILDEFVENYYKKE